MKHKTVDFESALTAAMAVVRTATGVASEMTLVRDIRGRIRLLLPQRGDAYGAQKTRRLAEIRTQLGETLGPYGFPADQSILFAGEMAISVPNEDRILLEKVGDCPVFLLDRQVTGQDWLRKTFPRKTTNPRVTFFGVKGGVGRSTALVIWAWHLAKQGKKVLVCDLDLESPGVSSTLLPSDNLPDYGIVDWFVEDGVGQAGAVEGEMCATSPMTGALAGEIRIVPAFGAKTNEYLPKLARCYAGEASPTPQSSWGGRLERLVACMEERERPDIVLLDSRAGIHDIAAVAVTRMDAMTLFFAVDSPQTWRAYSFLFRHWKQHPQLAEMRQRFQIVASMIPETGREAYVQAFREHAWDLFREHVYDQADADAVDAFTYDLGDEEAPHYPLPIFWHRALQEFDPARSQTGFPEKTASEAMDLFMASADGLAFGAREEE